MTKPSDLRKKFGLYLIVGSLSLGIVLICCEILVRLFLPFNTPDVLRNHSLQYAGSIFSRHYLKPNQIVRLYDPTQLRTKQMGLEAYPTYFINAVGYRGADFSLRKPNGITRIVILGGSSVFDLHARDASADKGSDWPHLVGQILKRQGFENIEVINAGIPGHASFDSLGRLYSQLWMYEPDYVLFYGAWNDIKYFRQLAPETPLISRFHPLKKDSNPFIEYQGFLDRFLSKSQVYVRVRYRYYAWKFPVGDEGVLPEAEYQDTYSAYAVKQYKLNLNLIVDACRNIGAIPVLVTEATLVSPNNSAEERKMIHYDYQLLTHSALVKAFDDAYEVIRSIGREKGVPVLDLSKEFNGNVELFTDAVHFTTKGSEKIANRVADFLARDLPVK